MRIGTYSIVARDPSTGELGVAVQSHWFSVGSVVSWARPGVGAVATQSVAEIAHGPQTLDRIAKGASAPEALAAQVAGDASARVRQVAAVDAQGNVGAHTGADCVPFAGHVEGDGFSCQANMMLRETVPAAMAAAFRVAEGSLASRMMRALEAAEEEGGDVRGRQSAALLVVPAEGEPWETTIDLRVEDHDDPLGELQRVLDLQHAYELAGVADELMGRGEFDEAGALYRRASQMAPRSDELLFWAGLAIAHGGDVTGGTRVVREAMAANPRWEIMLDRLTPDFAPARDAVLAELREDGGPER